MPDGFADKQVFPSLEFIGWYTVAHHPVAEHIGLHEQFLTYTSNPLLLVLQPTTLSATESQALPVKAYEPTVEIRDRKSRNVFVEVGYKVETGEAERIAVDWSAKGGEGSGSCKSRNVLLSIEFLLTPDSDITSPNSTSSSANATWPNPTPYFLCSSSSGGKNANRSHHLTLHSSSRGELAC